MSRHSGRTRGVTLVELVIAITIIAVALGGTLMAVNATTRHSADPMIGQQALAIAESYLEEVLLQPYIDPDLDPISGAVCPSAEASRDLYDNVCDYAGLDDAGAIDQNGNSVAGLAGYRVRVGVDTGANLGGFSGSADVLRIDVRVSHPASVDLTLSGYRTRS